MERSCCPPSFTSSTITTTTSSSSSSSSTTTTTTTTTSTVDHNAGTTGGSSVAVQNALRQLNKSSYKISKQSRSAGISDCGNHSNHKSQPPPLPPQAAPPAASPPPPPSQQQLQPPSPSPSPPPPGQQQPVPPQPPVYNIHKNDFRDVVQKLTGFPAHRPRVSSALAAPAPSPPKNVGGGTSSRLQKIRPPPLAQLTSLPPPPLARENNPLPQAGGDAGGSAAWVRPSPLSPLPPFPAVSAAAESPITAYMRCLRSGVNAHQQSLIPSPRGGSSGGILLPLAPSSPRAFGCVPSPRSACQGMLSQGLPFPPSPMASPRWGDQ